MSFSGFTFNGKHTYHDLGLTIESRNIGNPAKIKNIERVPYSNVTYDFTRLFDGQEYENRTIEYTLNLFSGRNAFGVRRNIDEYFHIKETIILNWLTHEPKRIPLFDDAIPHYYFMAEVVSEVDTEYLWRYGKMNVSFTAYPFKIGAYLEGNDLWDPFVFDIDAFQDTEFEVEGIKDVTLINVGNNTVVPEIEVSNDMTVVTDLLTVELKAGTHKTVDIPIEKGENDFTLIGDGSIEFRFRKELV